MLSTAQQNQKGPQHVASPGSRPRTPSDPSGSHKPPGPNPGDHLRASKGPGSHKQLKGPMPAANKEGPPSPSSNDSTGSHRTNQVSPSSPFSYAAAVANRSKAPFFDSIECEQYRALATKARASPRILSIQLQRPPASEQGPEKAPDQSEWGELIFNACGIDPKDIKGIDFQAGGILNCEIKLTDSSDLAKYAGKSGKFHNFNYNTLGPAESEVTISFKGVPLSVPDVEIIHLLKAYGYKPSKEGVHHSPIPVTSLDPEVSCRAVESTTRTIRATPPTSKRLRAYYFWAGMQESDLPRRVTVDHKGRGPRQCPHCLKSSQDPFPCPFNGKGSACKKHNPAKRTSLAQYNKILKEQDGYQSLRHLMLSSPAAESDHENDTSEAQIELEEEVAPAMALPSLMGSWADEPSTLCPEIRVDLEHQVEFLTKKLADAENMLTAGRSRRRYSQVDKDALENSRALSLSRKHCVTRIRELLTEEETHSWSKNTESLIAMLSSTTKLSDFSLSPEGVLTVKEGRDPFAELFNDIQSIPERSRDKAYARVKEVVNGAMTNIKVRMLHLENNKVRSGSRGRESDSHEEVKSSKFHKSTPLSPSDKGSEIESWPALPSPGAKVASQEAIQTLGGCQDPSKEPTGIHNPQKDPPVLEGSESHPDPGPTGSNGPQRVPLGPKGPEVPPQPNTHREAPKSEGPPQIPKEPLEPHDPKRAPEHSEKGGAPRGGPQQGAKEDPPESGHQGPINKWLNQGQKHPGTNLKAPQPRSQKSSAKGDAKVTSKARQ